MTSFADIFRNMYLCVLKNSPPEAVSENCSQSAREVFDGDHRLQQRDEIHFIVNLGQKYEGDLGF